MREREGGKKVERGREGERERERERKCVFRCSSRGRPRKKKRKEKRIRSYSASCFSALSHSKRQRREDIEAHLHPYRSSKLSSREYGGAARLFRRASHGGKPAAPPPARAGASPRGPGRGRQAQMRRCGPPSREGSSQVAREDARMADSATGLPSSSSLSPLLLPSWSPPPRSLQASPSFLLLQSCCLPRRRSH